MERRVQAKSKKPAESHTEMTEIVLPQHTNALGTVFGGVVMSWVDIAAATCALRHCNRSVVTASIDAMHFLAPIKLGWVVNLKASVNFTATSSCEVGVKVIAENPITEEYFHTASAFVTLVALDSHGKPAAIPKIDPQTDEEKRRYGDGEKRRQHRIATRKALQNRRTHP